MVQGKNILFAWELGEGFGHLSKSLPLMEQLVKRGHQITYVARELHTFPAFARLGIKQLQAPLHAAPKHVRRTYNFSELLLNAGFGLPREFAVRVESWQTMFDLMKPSHLITDYAPTAALAARIHGIPAALFGTGFFVPPTTASYPNMTPWDRRSDSDLAQADKEATDRINEMLAILGAAPVGSIHEIYDRMPRYISSFREMDHYGRQDERFYGPLFTSVSKEAPVWPNRFPKKIFIYLTARPALVTKLLRALVGVQADVMVLLRNVPSTAVPRHLPPHIKMLNSPIDTDQVLRQCDLVVNHSSMAMVSASALAGVPMILAPKFLEQAILCNKATGMGIAREIAADDPERKMAQTILEVLSDKRYKMAAEKFSAAHAGYRPSDAAHRIVEDMEKELLC